MLRFWQENILIVAAQRVFEYQRGAIQQFGGAK